VHENSNMEEEMDRTLISTLVLVVWCALPGLCQQAAPASETVPLYRVTVIERSVDAINYQYRAGPTKIDFRGTVLLTNAKGDATVESHRGRTEIDAKLDNLVPPTRFGREYLTYVLWAISPDGAPHNLGEVIPDGSNHAHLKVTTDLQVFGLIVTAEPHSAVRQPSDVVVLENYIRPDTLGRAQPIQAKYELMPRGQYTYQVRDSLETAVNQAPKVSMNEYEAILELYQAQNAIGIAQAAHAQEYAPNTLAKAQQALAEAQRLGSVKANSSLIVEHAREAAEIAEDARAIAERRQKDEQLVKAQTAALEAQQAKAQAEAAAQQARAEAEAARTEAEAQRAARELAEADAASARQSAERAQADRIEPSPIPSPTASQPSRQAAQTALRVQLLERLNGVLTTRDTPRGLVVTVTDAGFAGSVLRPQVSEAVAAVARILAAEPGLHIKVEGYSDSSETQELSARRAATVSDMVVASGLPADRVSSVGLGDARPLESNLTEAGRLENRRVEIVVSGDPIGALPYWDKPYKLSPQR
jgi:flagellar motor protein MotB